MQKALPVLGQLPPDVCWPWPGRIAADGYGTAGAKEAHREVFKHYRGEIPPGMDLDHRCHNDDAGCQGGPSCLHRRCVNPWHLDPVPQPMNAGNTVVSRRAACGNGHAYTAANTRVRIGRSGRPGRQCKECGHLSYIRRRDRHHSKR